MKQAIFFLLLCFIGACKKDNNTNICDNQAPPDNMPIYSPGNMEHGNLTACRNGKNWEASGMASKHIGKENVFYLGGDTYTYDGISREIFSILEIPLQLGKYTVWQYTTGGGFQGKTLSRYSLLTGDGDVFEDFYRLSESQNNYVEITKLDTVANKVAGYFELHFVVQQPPKGEQNSEEVYFKNGTFEVDIVE